MASEFELLEVMVLREECEGAATWGGAGAGEGGGVASAVAMCCRCAQFTLS